MRGVLVGLVLAAAACSGASVDLMSTPDAAAPLDASLQTTDATALDAAVIQDAAPDVPEGSAANDAPADADPTPDSATDAAVVDSGSDSADSSADSASDADARAPLVSCRLPAGLQAPYNSQGPYPGCNGNGSPYTIHYTPVGGTWESAQCLWNTPNEPGDCPTGNACMVWMPGWAYPGPMGVCQ